MSDPARGDLQVYDGPAELAAALAQVFVDCAEFALTQRGGFYVALAGGTTPKAAYNLLAGEPYATDVGWSDVFVYFSDERCVPPDDEQSNYLMAKDALLDRIKIPAHNVHRMHGEDDPRRAAQDYSQILKDDLGENPRFDLILLGMGPDGHTASLFPGSNAQTVGAALVAAPYVEKVKAHRLTLTPRVINNARRVVIATEGSGKAPVLASVLRGPIDVNTFPVQIVRPVDGVLTWMVDRSAASQLET
ncbi:MAG: 6-phosphogluconolactonase [Vulcanimicrobiaceae bacterium]